ncbi:hypothetical protein [Duganella sp. BuS-21]|uniref:hypothetical protein n=1 Tax=Duganella sp. BuS-21 TaxID=2943848 RepID=UPI0035A72470
MLWDDAVLVVTGPDALVTRDPLVSALFGPAPGASNESGVKTHFLEDDGDFYASRRQSIQSTSIRYAARHQLTGSVAATD